MKSWTQLFAPHILARGKTYYEDGRVAEPEHSQNCCTAAVHGTTEYRVSIFHSGEVNTDMTCTCPYAKDGCHCKHMAALLYALKLDLKAGESPEKHPPMYVRTDRPIMTVSRSPRFYKEPTFCCDKLSPEELQELLKTEFDAAARYYADEDGRMNKDALNRYASTLSSMMVSCLPSLQKKCSPQMVLETAFYALQKYCTYQQEALCDGVETMMILMQHVVNCILRHADLSQQEVIFSFLEGHSEDSHWLVKDAVDEMLMFSFDDPRYAARNLAMINRDLERLDFSQPAWMKEDLLRRKNLLLHIMPEHSSK